ncbi:MAG: ATP phosphoribosyltransferase regulatory subunit [Oscillospiraceae bacterium]|nr:ATP phosphoribosyltransferase regulatory subunit [Oscillospiraceae bacterium]
MIIDESVLSPEERVYLSLRHLYKSYGYTRFKMNKFEEYDLYGKNKDFLVSDSVITFTDTSGKLMALRPDVTLSVVKRFRPEGRVARGFYNENVYRISGKTGSFGEICQAGIEAIGPIDEINVFEVVLLAAMSLKSISERSVLNISHLGILSSVLSGISSDGLKSAIIKCVGDKNAHSIREICSEASVPSETAELLCLLASSTASVSDTINAIREKTSSPDVIKAIDELVELSEKAAEVSGVSVKIDLSLVGDMNYYNGIIMSGFIEGVPARVLAGGRYDRLMEKMNKPGGAVGFAIYLDLLERMNGGCDSTRYSLILADKESSLRELYKKADELIAQGKKAIIEEEIPSKESFEEIIDMRGAR